jgi:hypothetical protein
MFYKYGIAFVVASISSLSRVILIKISKYERHSNFEDETKSRIIKVALLNSINIGLIIVLNSINYQAYGFESYLNNDFLFKRGNFVELSSAWYEEVSNSILLTMTFAIIGPVVVNYAFHVVRQLKRLYD